MEFSRKPLLAVLILVIFIIYPQPSPASEQAGYEPFPRQTLPWSELIFKGSKFFSSLTVTIRHNSGGQILREFSKDKGIDLGDCEETAGESELLTVQFSSRVVGLGQGKYEERIWFDKMDAHPYSRIRMSSDEKPWVKSYCWEKKGVRRRKIQPENTSEIDKAPAKWTKHTEAFYMYPGKAAGCKTISDPSLVLVLLSDIVSDGLEANPYEICVFGKKELHRLTIKEEKSQPRKVAYRERSLSQETAVEGQIFPLLFSISTENITTDKMEPETFSFLGLQKDIRIYVDPEKRLPVRISGTTSSIGRLVLDLKIHSKNK